MKRLILFLLAAFMIGSSVGIGNAFFGKENLFVTVHNPYNISLILEVKCDYNSNKKQFDYYVKKALPKKGSTLFTIPKFSKHCEVWPSR